MIQLVGNKRRNGIHRTGTIQRHDSGQIFDRSRPHIHADTGNAGALQLENTLCLAFCQHFKGFRIIIRHFVNVKAGIDLTDLLLGIFNNRKVTQTQEVHLQ